MADIMQESSASINAVDHLMERDEMQQEYSRMSKSTTSITHSKSSDKPRSRLRALHFKPKAKKICKSSSGDSDNESLTNGMDIGTLHKRIQINLSPSPLSSGGPPSPIPPRVGLSPEVEAQRRHGHRRQDDRSRRRGPDEGASNDKDRDRGRDYDRNRDRNRDRERSKSQKNHASQSKLLDSEYDRKANPVHAPSIFKRVQNIFNDQKRMGTMDDSELKRMIMNTNDLLHETAAIRESRNALVKELENMCTDNDNRILRAIGHLPDTEAQRQTKNYNDLLMRLVNKSGFNLPRLANDLFFKNYVNQSRSASSSVPTAPYKASVPVDETPIHSIPGLPPNVDLSKPPPMLMLNDTTAAVPSTNFASAQPQMVLNQMTSVAGLPPQAGAPAVTTIAPAPPVASTDSLANSESNPWKLDGGRPQTAPASQAPPAFAVAPPAAVLAPPPPQTTQPPPANIASVLTSMIVSNITMAQPASSISRTSSGLPARSTTKLLKKKRGGKKVRTKRLEREAAMAARRAGITTTKARVAASEAANAAAVAAAATAK